MKKFVGGGDDLCIHMVVMVMVFQGCPLINLPASSSSRPLSLVATTFYKDNEHNNQIEIDKPIGPLAQKLVKGHLFYHL